MFDKIARLKTKDIFDCRLFEVSIEYCQAKGPVPFKQVMAMIGQGLRDDFSDLDSNTGTSILDSNMDVSPILTPHTLFGVGTILIQRRHRLKVQRSFVAAKHDRQRVHFGLRP